MAGNRKKRTPSQIGKANRKNGGVGERKVVSVLREIWHRVSRDLNDVYKKEGIDLLNTGHTAETGVAVQVKYYEKHRALATKYDEIQPKDSRIPILVSWPRIQKNGKPLVVLSLEDFIRIAKDPSLLEIEPEESEFDPLESLSGGIPDSTRNVSEASLEFAKVLAVFNKQLIEQGIEDSETRAYLVSNFQVLLVDRGFFEDDDE